MRLGKWFLLLLLFSLLGSVIIPRYVPESFRPDFFVMLTVFLALQAPRHELLQLCWCTGLAKDLLCGGPLGGYALLCLATGAVVMRFRFSSYARLLLGQIVLGFLAGFLAELAYVAVWSLHALEWPPAGTVGVLLSASLVTGILTPGCLRLLDRLRRWLGIRRRSVFGPG